MNTDKDKMGQAQRLVHLRREKGLTAEQLAQAMTKAGTKVSRGAILTGNVAPMALFHQSCRYLRVF